MGVHTTQIVSENTVYHKASGLLSLDIEKAGQNGT